VKVQAAILREINTSWSVEEIELDPPREREVLVKMVAAGMCHSDEHTLTGSMPAPMPLIGGHEGAGIVVELGPGVTSLEVGDHVATSFIPSCGRCKWCASGQQNLCDLGAHLLEPGMIPDMSFRTHAHDGDVSPMLKLGTFADHIVASEDSLVKVSKDLDLAAISLLSCGVATGWGSAVHRAEVGAGDITIVVGIGGIGSAAVQGARMAGATRIIAVDPIESKRELAMEFGATHTAASMEEAMEVVMPLSNGQGADQVLLTAGVVEGTMLAPAMALIRKGGTCVVTGLGPLDDFNTPFSLFDLTLSNKEIKGSLFGSGNPRADIPHLADLYAQGVLKLDEMITQTYTLDDINQGYADMRDGKNIRGIIMFD
jgi:S-(hydroxymethyl)glutathione dehydrogenase/alcohol dehydrogenase